MELTVGEEDHADVDAAGTTGIATRGIARASIGMSGVKSGGDGAINCWSSSLVNKGTSTQGPQWSGGKVHGVICCDRVEAGTIRVVQRLFLANSKAMCPSLPIHKTSPAALKGMSRHKIRKRAVIDDQSPFIGSTRACTGKSDSLPGRYIRIECIEDIARAGQACSDTVSQLYPKVL
jgi:hypothetical protein